MLFMLRSLWKPELGLETQQQALMTLLHRSLGRTYFDPESLRGVADLFPVTVLYTIKLLFPQGSC